MNNPFAEQLDHIDTRAMRIAEQVTHDTWHGKPNAQAQCLTLAAGHLEVGQEAIKLLDPATIMFGRMG